MSRKPRIESLRKDIEDITLEIFRLCGKRFYLVKKLAVLKAENKLPIENLKVEESLKEIVLSMCQNYGNEKSFCYLLLTLLFKESKKIQTEVVDSIDIK